MSWFDLTFIFWFLPAVVAGVYLLPRRMRCWWLLAASAAFFAVNNPLCWVAAAGGGLLFDYLCVRLLWCFEHRPVPQRWVYRLFLAKSWGCLGALLWWGASGREVPFGGLVVLLSSISYVVDLYRGLIPVEDSIGPFALYCLFFGKLPLGPVLPGWRMLPELRHPQPEFSRLADAAAMFAFGSLKAGVLSPRVWSVAQQALRLEEGMTFLSCWTVALSAGGAVYLWVSGYLDAARGLGEMVGVPIPKTSFCPAQSRGLDEFFPRLHRSAVDFLDSYWLVPVCGRFKGEGVRLLVQTAGLTLMGVWLGVEWRCFAWAAAMGLLVAVWQWLWPESQHPLVRLAGWACTFFLTSCGWWLLLTGSRALLMEGLAGMVGLAPLRGGEVVYLLSSNWLLLAVAGVLCLNQPGRGLHALERRFPRGYAVVCAAGSAGMGLVLLSFLISEI